MVIVPEANPELEAVLRRQAWRARLVSLVVTTLLHLVVLGVLSLIVLPREVFRDALTIISSVVKDPPPDEPELQEVILKQPDVVKDRVPTLVPIERPQPLKPIASIDVNEFAASIPLPAKDDSPGAVAPLKGELGGRTEAGRKAAVLRYGGSAESEAAVTLALQWLKQHQLADGSWSFNHRGDKCDDTCLQPGALGKSNNGATALALLTFMGAGNSYCAGEYQQTVEQGLTYLLTNAKEDKDGLDLRGTYESNSGMYIQGLATICLAEAVAMNDQMIRTSKPTDREIGSRPRSQVIDETRRLRTATQLAVRFISSAQDSDGGWRYSPKEPGDTSVVGWQVMALVSAKSAGVAVPSKATVGIDRFLNRVESDGGAHYGYMNRSSKPSTTAIGLLCRIYRGWKPPNEALQRGVVYLSRMGPNRNDMYYNYYATQVLHQWGGDEWKKWNQVMREQLVTTQIRTGHGAGSWNIADPHGGEPGGRHYMTCLAAMTLEVYYRHLPLYEHLLEQNPQASTR